MGYADTLRIMLACQPGAAGQGGPGPGRPHSSLNLALIGLFPPVLRTRCTSPSGPKSHFLGRSSFSSASFFFNYVFPHLFLLLFHCPSSPLLDTIYCLLLSWPHNPFFIFPPGSGRISQFAPSPSLNCYSVVPRASMGEGE